MQVPQEVICGDCLATLCALEEARFRSTFLDPPFNQGKEYEFFDDRLDEREYWSWMQRVCSEVHRLTVDGGAVFFMQREKNAEHVLRCLRESGWVLQNLVIWRKLTSAVPSNHRFGKEYQIIAFASKGARPQVFNRLRIDPPPRPGHKIPRENGVFVTDCWDDIRELTSGYFAGEEAIRNREGERVHKQQSPVALLARIVLASSLPGEWILDPFAGTGTTAVVARQLLRSSLSIEIDPNNVELINSRLRECREADSVAGLRSYYRFTPRLDEIWPGEAVEIDWSAEKQRALFERREAYGGM